MATTRAQRRAQQRTRDRRCAPKPVDTFADVSSFGSNPFRDKITKTVELGCAIHRDRGTGTVLTIGTGHRAYFADLDNSTSAVITEDPHTA